MALRSVFPDRHNTAQNGHGHPACACARHDAALRRGRDFAAEFTIRRL